MDGTEKDKQIKDGREIKTEKDNLSSPDVLGLKVQKLTSALYLITNFLPDQDPLKWRLRDKSLEALSETLASVRGGRGGMVLFDSALDTIGQVVNLLEVALGTPGVSQMNFSLLRREYAEVREKMLGLGGESLGQEMELSPRSELVAPTPPSTASLSPAPKSKNSPSIKPKSVNTSRRDQILKFIQEHGGSSIKDISRILPNVSTKTVQRELSEMVQSGVLRREGDRRWSRYEMASE